MAPCRVPGAVGLDGRSIQMGEGTMCRHASPAPGRLGTQDTTDGLSKEQQGLLLDLTQFTLDIVGIFEPTPFADGTNAVISASRGDWLGAGLSLISVIPYVGDVAKIGKIPRYLQSLKKAISLAKYDIRFAAHLEPALGRLVRAIDSLPWRKLSAAMAEKVYRLRRMINAFLYRELVERVLRARLGSVPTSASLIRDNIETLVDFVATHQRRHKTWGGNASALEKAVMESASGIDIHSPVNLIRMEPGKKIVQYVDEWYSLDPGVAIRKSAEEFEKIRKAGELKGGSWFVMRQGAPIPNDLGIADAGRVRIEGIISEAVEVLESRASGMNVSWGTLVKENLTEGVIKVRGKNVIPAKGGATQYFLPDASNFIKYEPIPIRPKK